MDAEGTERARAPRSAAERNFMVLMLCVSDVLELDRDLMPGGRPVSDIPPSLLVACGMPARRPC